jgi:phthalate 4,5-dioxygenase oxygenase subunit
MLTREENELLCRVGPQTPMGKMMRRYWIPALLSDELKPGGDPKRVRLLGEDLVAFRDERGRVGLLDENCPHRGASLSLARAEGCGLRCLYHGWLIAADGKVLETPPEPEELHFKEKVRALAYPVRESGGVVWTYMGPAGLEPPPAEFEFCTLPLDRVQIMKVRVECNYAQVIEGVIDSAHSNYLHRDSIKPAKNDASTYNETLLVDRPSDDGKPRIEVKNTKYGFRYAAIRKPTVDPEKRKFVRVTLWIPPFYGMFPAPKGWGNMQAMVPIDDTHTMFYYFKYRYDAPITPEERKAHEAWSGFRMGIDIVDDREYRKVQSRENQWLQDRERMRAGSWTGISGVNMEDLAVQESMGPIFDRTKEHLGTSDVAVIRMRRLMIDSARALAERGETPIGLREPVDWRRLRAEEGMLPIDASWEDKLSVYEDEPAGAATR